MNGIDLITIERREQLTKHSHRVLNDVENNSTGQLRAGARKLLAKASDLTDFEPEGWDKKKWAKMCNKSYRDRLIIAGALIAAEIDRIDYNK